MGKISAQKGKPLENQPLLHLLSAPVLDIVALFVSDPRPDYPRALSRLPSRCLPSPLCHVIETPIARCYIVNAFLSVYLPERAIFFYLPRRLQLVQQCIEDDYRAAETLRFRLLLVGRGGAVDCTNRPPDAVSNAFDTRKNALHRCVR